MRTHSLYEFACECGQPITSPEAAITCPSCGALIQIEWPARLETITEPVSPPWPLNRLDATVTIDWTDEDEKQD